MENFDSIPSEERAPEKISQEEALELVEKISDDRLSADEDVEHFVITTDEKRVFIPKRKTIYSQNESGSFSHVYIEEYLKDRLDSLE